MTLKSIKVTIAFLLSLTLVACANNSPQIGTSVTLCCPGNYSEYATYSLDTQDMPLFLEDYMLAEFENAAREKGLYKGDRNSDLQITLRYKHVSLDAEQEDIDPFIRMESINVELRYLAVIEINMVDRRTSKRVWAGQISRFHSVSPGEYMHEGDARPAFGAAFLKVLEDYPS